MTQALALTPDCEVLEIGTGSGTRPRSWPGWPRSLYLERLESLSRSAQRVLGELGVDNVEFHIGDGTLGWPGARTFDRIMVTAAVQEVPGPLLDQLNLDGLLIALWLCHSPDPGPVSQDPDRHSPEDLCACVREVDWRAWL